MRPPRCLMRLVVNKNQLHADRDALCDRLAFGTDVFQYLDDFALDFLKVDQCQTRFVEYVFFSVFDISRDGQCCCGKFLVVV